MPVLFVPAAVTDRSLIDLATIKEEIGISDTSTDAMLTRWIKESSDKVAAACCLATDQAGRATLLKEAVEIAYGPNEMPGGRPGHWPSHHDGLPVRGLILPWRVPYDITSVTQGGDADPLDPTGYELEPMSALLWRLDDHGRRVNWEHRSLTITANVGFDFDDVPSAASSAVIDMVRGRWDARGRNSFLKVDQTVDVGRYEFATGTGGGASDVPDAVVASLRDAGLAQYVIG